jgi:hypothetical protein
MPEYSCRHWISIWSRRYGVISNKREKECIIIAVDKRAISDLAIVIISLKNLLHLIVLHSLKLYYQRKPLDALDSTVNISNPHA